jgi:mono/diheme cytochrome c family protein
MVRLPRFARRLLPLAAAAFFAPAASAAPDWTDTARIPPGGRPNPYGFDERALGEKTLAGRRQTLVYPVESTGVILPYRALRNFIESPTNNPFRLIFRGLIAGIADVRSMDDIYDGLGLVTYPEEEGTGAYHVPFPTADRSRPKYRMGVSLIDTQWGQSLTFSCTSCHGGQLFGKRIIGLSNRFAAPEEFYIKGLQATKVATPSLFRQATGATKVEAELWARTRENGRYVETRKPQALGVTAPMAPRHAAKPRDEILRTRSGDVKPAVWWNTKYKTRWFSDGSSAAGNPVLGSLIVNEIGRGSDLHELEAWIVANESKVEELTAAVFAMEAPRFTDFFPAELIDVERAKKGQKTFEARCASCHGRYDKAWDQADAAQRLSGAALLETTLVTYHERTPVVDVGTDPNRFTFMESFSDGMNRLSVNRRFGIESRPAKGYVPPPLVGIWARWPYFHNNSAPSLCAVLSAAKDRPVKYWPGEAIDKARDFDRECNGYPTGRRVPAAWKKRAGAEYDSRRDGLSNRGHEFGAVLSPAERLDLIQFLQTL